MTQVVRFARIAGAIIGVPLLLIGLWSSISAARFIWIADSYKGIVESNPTHGNPGEFSVKLLDSAEVVKVNSPMEEYKVGESVEILRVSNSDDVRLNSFWSIWGLTFICFMFGPILLGCLPMPPDEEIEKVRRRPPMQIEESAPKTNKI